ncbi:MAG: putative lipid flippase FtsW [Patescibacteria group bacterium]|nr:putative lipid flippase FtsW [Patescibacteria group bacterium]
MKKYFQFDKLFFWLSVALVVIGIFVFLSASFSAFGDAAKFKGILFNQFVLGLGGGIILFFIMLRFPIEFLRKYALAIYGLGLVLLILVFVPHIGFAHGGARRWLNLGPLSFQSVEFAKFAVIIYLAAWLSVVKAKIVNISQGLVPFGIIMGIVGALLLAQPDTDSFLIILVTGVVMYILAGAKWRDIGIMLAIGIIAGGSLLVMRPYLMARIKDFIDPSRDALGSSYQVQQQLIAIGSGKLTGRGFGQGIQKFQYLPEPLGDSIFSVAGEEFGFLGLLVIILVYVMFFFRGIWIANRIKDPFGKLLVIGIVGLIVFQSFLNIASATAVFPLGGLPLIFISHGGTALAFAIGAIGIVLNISRTQQKESTIFKK